MRVDVSSPKYDCKARTGVDCLDSVAVRNDGEITVFVMNRNIREDLETEIVVEGAKEVIGHIQMAGHDMKTANSLALQTVTPRDAPCAAIENETLKVIIPKASWNVVRLRTDTDFVR